MLVEAVKYTPCTSPTFLTVNTDKSEQDKISNFENIFNDSRIYPALILNDKLFNSNWISFSLDPERKPFITKLSELEKTDCSECKKMNIVSMATGYWGPHCVASIKIAEEPDSIV